MRRTGLGRRGEGHVEYVIIAGLIAICAVVSLFSFFDAAKQVALDRRLCIDCLADQQEVDSLDPDGDGLDDEGNPVTRPRTPGEEIAAMRTQYENDYPMIFAVAEVLSPILGSSHVVAWLRSIFYPELDAMGDVRYA